MTSELPIGAPWRTAPDHIRRAALADASIGDDGTALANWLIRSGADPTTTIATWSAGRTAELPIGVAWDTVRLPQSEGWSAIRHLRTVGAPVGPVLHSTQGVEFLVLPESAGQWDLTGTSIRGRGETLLAPAPSVVAPRTVDAATWLVPPVPGDMELTEAADLYGAYAAAMAALGSTSGRWR